jgi:2-keto-4-pentenoate hydratase/2-oxohepta-3-ene-1,7-dioic acid hydratase in catechol pathway
MRWATYVSPGTGQDRVGLVEEQQILGLAELGRLIDLLGDDGERLATAAEAARRDPFEVVAVADAPLRAPIPEPPSVRDFAAFERHISTWLESWGRKIDPDWFELPVFYFQNTANICGPGDVKMGPGSAKFDFELEVAAVVGREGENLSPENAEAHIAGYMVFCDWSSRDLQEREMKHLVGAVKSKDTSTSIGPYLVTPDELEPFRSGAGFDLEMKASVNGQPYSAGSLAEVYWSFPQMLTYASRGTRVRPGDVIATGTVGTGCILELSAVHGEERYPWLAPGDLVELEVQQLGRLEHRVLAGAEVVPYK